MRKLALIVLAAASLSAMPNVASAQYWRGHYYNNHPRHHHHHHRYYRHYNYDRGGGYYRAPMRSRSGNGCRPGYTVQDGRCKPYTGR